MVRAKLGQHDEALCCAEYIGLFDMHSRQEKRHTVEECCTRMNCRCSMLLNGDAIGDAVVREKRSQRHAHHGGPDNEHLRVSDGNSSQVRHFEMLM